MAVTTVLVLAPILPIVYQSLLDRPLYDASGQVSLENYRNLFTSREFQQVVGDSFLFASLATVMAVVLGAVFAVLVGRTNVPGRALFSNVLLWPLYLSPLVVAFGWVIMYGPAGYVTGGIRNIVGFDPWYLYSIPGMALVAAISEIPVAYLFCSSSVSAIDASLEDAARSSGAGPIKTFFSVTLPLMRPPILYSAVLIFATSLEMLSIPLILGQPVGIDFFSSFLYTHGIATPRPDYGLLGAASVLLLAIVTVLVVLQTWLLGNAQRFVTVKGKASRPRTLDLGLWRWLAAGLIGLYVFAGAIIPIGGLLMRAFTKFLTPLVAPWRFLTFDNVQMIFSYPAYTRSITNSVTVALVGGIIATLFIALVSLVAHRSDFRFRRSLDFLALFPRSMPGIIVGIGLFWAMVLIQPLGFLRNTIWILVIAFSIRYLPTGFAAISPMVMRFGAELDNAARTMGADWWTASRKIMFVLIKPALYSSFVLLSIQFVKEYSSAVFLFAPGSEVMGTTMLQFWIQGDTGPVAALAMIQIVITSLLAIVSRKVLGVRVYA
jgi:iron(III) transport system permease protein